MRRHLRKHRDQLLVCLYEPSVEPTNNLAERELRNAVIVRKRGGCHRSDAHTQAHAVLASVAQTTHRCGVDFTNLVTVWLMPGAEQRDLLALFWSLPRAEAHAPPMSVPATLTPVHGRSFVGPLSRDIAATRSAIAVPSRPWRASGSMHSAPMVVASHKPPGGPPPRSGSDQCPTTSRPRTLRARCGMENNSS